MRRLTLFFCATAILLAVAAPALAQSSQTFESGTFQTTDNTLVVYQRYYTTGGGTINPACDENCPTKPCTLDGGVEICQLTYFAPTAKNPNPGYRGYQESLFNYGTPSGTSFISIQDVERNAGLGNHQGFYAWTTGVVNESDTNAWNNLECVGTLAGSCLGNANETNSRDQTGVPTSSGAVGGSISNIGGFSPIPVPKAAPGSTSSSFNLTWDPVSSVGKNPGVAAAGYEVWGVRSANCSSPAATGFQFVKLVAGTSTTVNLTEVPGTGNAVTFALKIRYPSAGATPVSSRYLSANGQCFLGGGLSASVYELAAKYAGKTNVEVTWKTSLEDGVRGFYVSRATTQNGPYSRVSDLIAAKGEASAYSFIDAIQMPAGNVKATGLWYKIETIDIDDNAVEYGPIKAQVPGPSGNSVIKQRTAKPQR